MKKQTPKPDQVDPNCAEDMIGSDPEPEDGWRNFDEKGNRLPRKPPVRPEPEQTLEKRPPKKP